LLYRKQQDELQLLLVHPGGPFWAKKDAGAWTIPKGELSEGEDPLSAAKREFNEETGHVVTGPFTKLTPLKQKSGKLIYAWAAEGDLDLNDFKSNEFEMEWPPRSGKYRSFPEADKAGWFSLKEASVKILPGQLGFVSELAALLKLEK